MVDHIELASIAAALFAGILLAGIYFGGLWWTVGQMVRTRWPLRFYVGSLIIRLAIVGIAFSALLARFDWPQLAAMLCGFFVVRVAAIRLVCGPICSRPLRQEAA